MKTKHKNAGFWAAVILIIAAFDYGAVILAISFYQDMVKSWEGNVDYLIIFIGGLFYLAVVLAFNLVIFWEAKGLITREKKCNTCGEPLFLPIGADHLMCALRYHPFRALLGWLFFISWYVLGVVRCPAARRFRMKEALLRRQIRKEAFLKGLRKGGETSAEVNSRN